jgi:hypothetical protein
MSMLTHMHATLCCAYLCRDQAKQKVVCWIIFSDKQTLRLDAYQVSVSLLRLFCLRDSLSARHMPCSGQDFLPAVPAWVLRQSAGESQVWFAHTSVCK